jgi:hypothetical protein
MPQVRPIVEIVSSASPCGVTFLLNILVELELLIYAGRMGVFWSFNGEDATPSPSLQRKFGLWIPSLNKDRFRFRDGESAFTWSHDWPQRQDAGRKRILFVRDPRDALFSQYKRSGTAEPVERFLQEPVRPLGTTRIHRFCLQKSLWMELSDPDRFLIVRFEELKQDPLTWTRKILQFAGLQRDDDAILAAVRKSSTDKVKAELDRTMQQSGIVEATGNIIRKGMPFEWKSAPDRADLALYGDPYTRHVLGKLGYDGAAPASERPAADPADETLARRWTSDLYGSGSRYVLPEQRERVQAEMLRLIQAGDPETKARLQARSSRSFPYTAFRELRMGIFCMGIRISDLLLRISRRALPPLERCLVKLLLAFPLGER